MCALILACGLAIGCAAQKSGKAAEQARVERFRHSYEASLNEEQELAGQKLLQHARSAIGTPYVLGGSNPGGFDCSGFVHWAYRNVGVKLPRTAREQSVVGEGIRNIEDMRAGDIVAFRHPKRGYHTGIYVGDGKFIHSPRKRTRVRINSLSDPYFSKTLLGARRVSIGSGENLVAQAESRLAVYADAREARKGAKAATVASASAKGSKAAKAGKSVKTAKSKVSKSAAKSAKSGKSVKSAKKSGKGGAVASAQKPASGKSALKSRVQASKAPVKAATKPAAAKSTASRKSGHKTVSSLSGKSSRNRS
ncbi:MULTISPECIES: NlpC/P60 family protein [unclassified Desulfovibrio]|uniref:NlpC/P60 family protein n=1 Tax=unclassified Desulfovibrio TaxID=2593640 RepID=UPI001F1514D5|nr:MULTISPECIES: NlpC/P60 family protein [unclassified Desulfovibrio]